MMLTFEIIDDFSWNIDLKYNKLYSMYAITLLKAII